MSIDFFNSNIKDADPEVYETLKKELLELKLIKETTET